MRKKKNYYSIKLTILLHHKKIKKTLTDLKSKPFTPTRSKFSPKPHIFISHNCRNTNKTHMIRNRYHRHVHKLNHRRKPKWHETQTGTQNPAKRSDHPLSHRYGHFGKGGREGGWAGCKVGGKVAEEERLRPTMGWIYGEQSTIKARLYAKL